NPNGWVPEQKISIAEAVAAYTSGSAFAEFQETEKGTIERGKLADLVVLNDDIFKIAPAAIKDVRVMTTIVGGRVVYSADQPRNHETISWFSCFRGYQLFLTKKKPAAIVSTIASTANSFHVACDRIHTI